MNVDFRHTSSMDHSERVPELKRNRTDEAVLDILNGSLAELEQYIASNVEPRERVSLLIVGAPRSGTTYLSQLLASRHEFGYISNLMARFFGAPLTGAWLQSRLIRNEMSELSSLSSAHGVTRRVFEPHEFGYFWARHMPFAGNNHEECDRKMIPTRLLSLERELCGIAGVFGKPVVYKSVLPAMVLDVVLQHTSLFVVHLVRDRRSVVNSILAARKARFGAEEKWWSLRPKGWEDMSAKPPSDQVRWQVDRIESAITNALSCHPMRSVRVDYESIARDPAAMIDHILRGFHVYAGSLDD